MTHDVFISYSHKDKPIADAICTNLEIAGFRCWIAPRDIAPGLDWPTAISEAIARSRMLVLVFSAASNGSKQVGNEISLAFDNNLIILPFKIDNILPEPGKQYYLARTHWLDAMNPPTQEQINTLVGIVESFLKEHEPAGTIQPVPGVQHPAPQPARAEPARHPRGTKRKSLWLWGILLLVAIIGGSILAVRSFGQAPTPTSTSTPTHTSTSTITSTSTLWPSSTPRPTATQPAWVTEFAQPILDAIASRSPSFQDDFHDKSGGWQLPSYCGSYRLEYLDGEMVVNRCPMEHNDFGYRSYVVEVEGRFLPGSDKTQSEWSLKTPEHGISVLYPGYGWMDGMDYPSSTILIRANPGTESNTLMIIVDRPRVAFYLNGQPLYYLEDDTIEYGKFSLRAYNPDQGQGGPMVTIVAFDNFKIWDISDLP